MSRITAFDQYSREYDEWFRTNEDKYLMELDALKTFVKPGLFGLEVGVGTGRFALPLGIRIGVEPSAAMALMAKERGLDVCGGVAENLPFPDMIFDFVVMVTAVCFVDSVERTFSEAFRVVRDNGFIVVAFIDRDSELGRHYEERRNSSRFYGDATFHSTREILACLNYAGFTDFEIEHCPFNPKPEEPGQDSSRRGFVVVRALKALASGPARFSTMRVAQGAQ